MTPVSAAFAWKSNAELIADVAKLGYLPGKVLDCTYGKGTFWRAWKPETLVASDLYTLAGATVFRRDGATVAGSGAPWDFRKLPAAAAEFDAAVLDGPFKLNGTATPEVDARYGVQDYAGWRDRHQLIREGMDECARVAKRGGFVLVKCQDQVCGGKVRWQTREFADHGESLGLTLVDRFDLLGKARKQPPRTRADGKPSVQQHAHGRPSTLLVFCR